MLNLTKRVNKLVEKTSSIECKDICKEVLEMNNVPEEQLESSLVEKLKGIKDSDKHVAAFVKSATKAMKIKNLGITKAISKIRESQSYHYPALRYTLDKFERAKVNEGIDDYLVVEDFISSMKDFVWDKNVKESLDEVRESFESEREAVLVSKALFEFRRAKGNFIFEKVCSMLEDHFDNPTEASRSALIESLIKFSYSPVAKSLMESLKKIQSSITNPNGLNIIAENNNCEVSPVYSTIFVENGKEFFTIKGDVFKKEGSIVEKVTPEEFQSLSENVKRSYSILNSSNFFVKEGKASFYLGKNKIEISEGENATKVLFNGKQIPSSDIARNLVSSGMIRLEEAKVASDIQFINDVFENFYEIDFAKVISSKIYEGSYATIMKVDDKIYLNRVNTSMKANEFFTDLNATQARNIVLEFLGYDIKESMVEFLEKDEAEILAVKEQQTAILTNMSIVEGELNKIAAAKQDAFIAAQPQIKALEEMLTNELSQLRTQYNELSSKLKKFEAKSSEAGVEIGEDVKLESGETATVTAIDSNTKKVSVVTADGKTSEHPISKITSVEKAQESAMKKNEEDANEEAEKEVTAKPEEDEDEKVEESTPNLGDEKKEKKEDKEDDEEEKVEEKKKDDEECEKKDDEEEKKDDEEKLDEDTLNIAGGNNIPVEDPNKDKLQSQEPATQPAKVKDSNPEYVPGKVTPDQEGSCAGKDVEVLAADMASKGPDDLIQVKCDGELYFIEKKFIEVSTTEGEDSTTIDFDAAPPSKEGEGEKKEGEGEKEEGEGEKEEGEGEKKEGEGEKEEGEGEKEEGEGEKKEGEGEKEEGEGDEEKKKPTPEELQSKLAKALEDLEQIRNDMKDTFTSNEMISHTINSLRGLNDALRKDLNESKKESPEKILSDHGISSKDYTLSLGDNEGTKTVILHKEFLEDSKKDKRNFLPLKADLMKIGVKLQGF